MESIELKNKIIISACLCGIKCRYDGKHKLNKKAFYLVQSGQAIALCPEVLAGLEIPRPAADVIKGRVIEKSGKDVTEIYQKGAEEAYNFCSNNNINIIKAILKDGSPSCGRQGKFSKLLASKNIKIEYSDKT